MAQGKISTPVFAVIVVIIVALIGLVGYKAMNKGASPTAPTTAQADLMKQRGGGTSLQH